MSAVCGFCERCGRSALIFRRMGDDFGPMFCCDCLDEFERQECAESGGFDPAAFGATVVLFLFALGLVHGVFVVGRFVAGLFS